MISFKKLYYWLLIDSIIVILCGAFICFFNSTSIFIFNDLINHYFWPDGIIPNVGTEKFMYFNYNLLGLLMIIWGMFILFILRNSFLKKEKWAWQSIFYTFVMWFLIDEFFSLYHGVYFNALFNLIFLGVFIIPLLLSRGFFRKVMKE